MRKLRKSISVILAVLMLISILPSAVLASEEIIPSEPMSTQDTADTEKTEISIATQTWDNTLFSDTTEDSNPFSLEFTSANALPSNGHNTWGYISKITISGENGEIRNYEWNGTTLNIYMSDATPKNATINCTFTGAGTRTPSISGHGDITLVDGMATMNVSATATFSQYNSSWVINFIVDNEPTLADKENSSTQTEIFANGTYELDLDELFTDVDEGDSLTYQVKTDNGEFEDIEGSIYTFDATAGGEYILVFKAYDGKMYSSDVYTLTITVKNSATTYDVTISMPQGLDPEFYAGGKFDNSGEDILGEELTYEAATAGGVTSYTVNVPDNLSSISIRAKGWGGVSIPTAADATVAMSAVQFTPIDISGEEIEGTYEVKYGEHKAVQGENGFLLIQGEQYSYTSTPADTATYKSVSATFDVTASNEVQTVKPVHEYSNPLTMTVPEGATSQLFKYNKYFDSTEIEMKASVNNGDGTVTQYFVADAKNNQLTYRVTMPGKITKSGYVDWGTTNMTVTYTQDDATPDVRSDYSTSTAANAGVGDDSVLVNVNKQNLLNMQVGSTFTLKAYRTWQIIKLDYENQIIEPDYHFNIVYQSDEGVITLENKDSLSSSGSGDLGDWKTVKANKEGIAIIEVTYDAIAITGGNFSGIYGATDPNRTGLVVVQVGSTDNTVDFGIDCFASQGSTTYSESTPKSWDAEFDTLYFTGDSGKLNLTPTADTEITEVAVSSDKGQTWTVLTGADGEYAADIMPGNNIIRVTTEEGVSYQVVRGDKVEIITTELEGDADGKYEAGETIRVMLKGLHTPIAKIAGNYNPGFAGNSDGYSQTHIKYDVNGELLAGKGSQYTFSRDSYIDIRLPEELTTAEYVLKDGYIGVGVIGLTEFTNGGDSHRNIPDGGCSTRGSYTTFNTRSILPEITIDVVPNANITIELDKDEFSEKDTVTAKVYLDTAAKFAIAGYSIKFNDDDAAFVSALSTDGLSLLDSNVDKNTGTIGRIFFITPDSELTVDEDGRILLDTITLKMINDGPIDIEFAEIDGHMDFDETSAFVSLNETYFNVSTDVIYGRLTADDKAEALAVDELIDSIGEDIVIGSADMINEAKDAYDNLDEVQKQYVENTDTLDSFLFWMKGDINMDGKVSAADLSILLYNYGTQTEDKSARADINYDLSINSSDLSLVLMSYGTTIND